MLAEESTVGTAVTVTRGYEVDDLKPTNTRITATALASASFLSALEVFHWGELTVKIGGTPSTSAGRTTVAGNATLNGLRGVTLRMANGLRTDRRFAGGGGIKSEQLENAFREATGELDCEFFDRTQLNDVYDTDASTALVFQWVGVTSDAGNFPTVRVTYPRAKLDTGTAETNGPDVLDDRVTFTAYEDDAGTHPLVQYEYESLDSAP